MLRRLLSQAFRGFCMGAADVVPGVSGGTIALVLGIYAQLLATVRQAAAAAGRLLRGDARGALAAVREVSLPFVVPLAVGIALAVVSLARLIGHLLEERPEAIAAVFLGLVGASIVVAWGLLRAPAPRHAVLAVVAAAPTFALLGFRGETIAEPGLPLLFGAGALAVCALILPGISGSFILLTIGLYDHVLGLVNDRALGRLAVLAAGGLVGLALFASLLDRLLRRHHDLALAVLIGIMAGSMRVLWPWPAGTESAALAAPPADGWLGPAALAVGGAATVLALVRLAGRGADAEPL